MIEIKFTLDATPALIGALQDLAGANNAQPVPSGAPCGQLTRPDRPAELREVVEKDRTAEKAPNLPSDAPAEDVRPETPESVEAPQKSKSRAKKAPSESKAPVAPAIDTTAEPAPAPVSDTPSPVEDTPAHVEDTPATVSGEPSPAIVTPATVAETPAPEPAPVVVHPDGTDPLAGKGQTGEILAELTRTGIGDLDALGVDRSEANRRIRAYCARAGIKFPTFPALLQAVGYAEAIAICKGA